LTGENHLNDESKSKVLSSREIRVLIAAFVIVTIIGCLIVGSILHVRTSHTTTIIEPSKNATFVLSGWGYPDEYGQGIEVVWPYENSTGSWVALRDPAFVFWYEDTTFEVNATPNTALKIIATANINHTLFDFGPDKSENASARAIMRVGIEVITSNGTVFSQNNMTWDGTCFDDTATTWSISYEAVVDVLVIAGTIYTATITYEVYYESLGEYGGSYLHDCSDTNDMTYDSDAGLDPSDYGIGSNGSVVEIWIVPDSVVDEKVIYKLDFPNFANSSGNINLTVRYRVEDGFIGFRLDLYYDDATSDSTGLQTSQTWSNLTIVADSSKTLDYALLYCDDNPASVSSGNRSVYVDFIEITGSDGLVFLFDQWNIVATAPLIFSVSFDYWALNMVLIFGGLVVMIVSACLIAVKVRDRTITDDSGMLALILFCVGWGLFAGGMIIG
jgi:hypothetical protein